MESTVEHKGRILVVDDDRLVLATLVHGLSRAGYEVIDADNGDDAILLARAQRPELALLDIRMEGKSGFDVAEYLRDVCHIPFMFLSAFADAATLAKVEELGALDYLTKPLDVGQILLGQRRHRQHDVWDVQPLVVRQRAADHDRLGRDHAGRDRPHRGQDPRRTRRL